MDSSSKTQTSATKNWLIRTKQKQILGPVTKEKLISFVEKGALGPEDEVMSGNGYWFALKEKELLDKYLLGDIPQSFDPISEAKTVLSVSKTKKEGTSSLYPNPDPLKLKKEQLAQEQQADSLDSNEEKVLVPDEEELAYPDVGDVGDVGSSATPTNDDLEYPDFGDIPPDDEPQTQVLKLDSSLSEKKATPEDRSSLVNEIENDAADDSLGVEDSTDWDGNLPAQEDLEYPDFGGPDLKAGPQVESESTPGPEPEPEAIPPEQPEVDRIPVKKKSAKQTTRKKKVIEAPKRNDRYLFYILALVVLLTLGVFYYYRKILNKPFPLIGAVVTSAHAQSLVQDPSGLKKKEFLNLSPFLKTYTAPRSL